MRERPSTLDHNEAMAGSMSSHELSAAATSPAAASAGKDDELASFSSSESVNLPPVRHLNPFELQIRSTPAKGRGVYATRDIPRGSLVEISPVLLIPVEQYRRGVDESELKNYVFTWNWGPGKGKNGDMALALGLGSIFNHSRRANVSYKVRPDNLTIEYSTTSVVRTGEELCIYYGNLRFEREEQEEDEEEDHDSANWDNELANFFISD